MKDSISFHINENTEDGCDIYAWIDEEHARVKITAMFDGDVAEIVISGHKQVQRTCAAFNAIGKMARLAQGGDK